MVLEIGSAYGYSAIVIAQVAKLVTAVDPHTQFDSEATFIDNLIQHQVFERVRFWTGPAADVLPRLFARGQSYDLVFIDGDHLPGSVRHDLAWARRLVRAGGAIALHDYLLGPGTFVRPACQEWREPDRLVETLCIYEGVEPEAGERGPGGP